MYYRSSIVIYKNIDNIKYYCLGLEPNICMLVDFGGHVEPDDNDIYDTAIREYKEETSSIFGEITKDILYTSDHVDINSTLTFFVDADRLSNYDMSIYRSIFRCYPDELKKEIMDLVWFTEPQLYLMLENPDFCLFGHTKLNIFYKPLYNALKFYLNTQSI